MENPEQATEKQQGGDLPEGLIFVSSGSEAQEEDEDHEEGEIQDEDDEVDLKQQDLEDISSEEESTIRERMAALEAMDKRVSMMKKLANRSSKYADYLDEEDDIVNGKENLYYYYQHAYKHRSAPHRSRKAPAYHPPSKDNRHPGVTTKHQHTSHRPVATKRHLKDGKSSKKSSSSSHRRHKRRRHVSPDSPSPTIERRPPSSDSEPEAVVDREYLKIACGIGNGKNQRSGGLLGERNPLRKKLFQGTHKSRKSKMRSDQLVAAPAVATTQEVINVIVDSSSNEVEEEDEGEGEEEEELQLRLLALSTKPIVREAGLGELIPDAFQIPSPPPPPSITDALPEAVSAEEQELRLIALKTAVLKKHASRQKRRELDNERPYSPSDDIVLSPVRELPPTYDDGVYSDEQEGSVEFVDDDDVQIVEPHYEHIDLLDSEEEEDEEMEVDGNDMEISPLGSPSERSAPGIGQQELMEDDSQQPIDMELASSDRSSSGPSPVYGGVVGGDSCDSALFHRRGDIVPESPSETPDSMEEAEAEALRHLLLTKMRQKRNRMPQVETSGEGVALKEESVSMDKQYEDTQSEQCSPVPPEEQDEQQEVVMEEDATNETSLEQHPARKSRKKSLSNNTTSAEEISSNQLAIDIPPKTTLVHTQKLVNNPNKLINLNRTAAAPSPPVSRTESPKDPAMVDTFVSRPVPKLVIRLGQSDSDSDVDFGTPSPQKATSGDTPSPGVRFEEQLEMFLKTVRSKSTSTGTNVGTSADDTKEMDRSTAQRVQDASDGKNLDSAARQPQQAKSLAKKAPISSSAMATPTAVKHLSKSAQLEYMRLVERMAQLERDKLARQNSAHTSATASSDKSAPRGANSQQQQQQDASSGLSAVDQHKTDPKFGKSPGRRKQSQSLDAAGEPAPVLDPIEKKLQQIRTSIPNLSEASRNRLLHTAERHLEKHSESFVGELEQHNAIILEAQQARRELYHLESRIDLLREKLSLLERARERHRHRSLEKFTSLQVTRKKILSSRKRSGELERMCFQIGRAIRGETYQLPGSATSEEVHELLRILVAETQQLRGIRKPSLEQFKEEMIANHKRRLATWQETPMEAEPVQEGDDEQQEQEVMEEGVEQEDHNREQEAPEEQSADTVNEEEDVHETVESVPKEMPEEIPSTEGQPPEPSDQPAIDSIQPLVSPALDEPVTGQSLEAGAPPSPVEEKEVEQSGNDVAVPHQQENETITHAPPEPFRHETAFSATGTDPDEPEFRIEKYTSPLTSLKQGAQNIPTGILCPYELGGQCVDQDCKFEHFSQRAA
uniref:Zf-C3H1 domain-containing protein n=1 Tax=Anopheles dirus TaxID=7168 RepID=A0A182N2F6_9DIPT